MRKQIGLMLAMAVVVMAPLTALADKYQMGDMYGPQMPERWYKFTSYMVDRRNQPPAAKGQPQHYSFIVQRNRDADDTWIDKLIAFCTPVTVQGKVRTHNTAARPIPSMFIWHFSDKMVPAPQGGGVMMPELVEQILLSDVHVVRTSLTGNGGYTSGTETLLLTFDRAMFMDRHGKVVRDDNWSVKR